MTANWNSDILARRCPSCEGSGVQTFYDVARVPVHSVLLMPSRDAALGIPAGRLSLGFCRGCGFIFNQAFDPALLSYSESYEETQGFSGVFQAFHRELAQSLVDRYGLRGKRIVEIGCGKGEFLALLCELGGNHGVGFDPSFVPGRAPSVQRGRIQFIQDFYSEQYRGYDADFICCKMTLEHIAATADFLRMIRENIGGGKETLVFFQVPDVSRILRELAFWDTYYEHCSYFSAGSLARLFRHCGFDVVDLQRGYGGQYLMIGAVPGNSWSPPPQAIESDLDQTKAAVQRFSALSKSRVAQWRFYLDTLFANRARVILWGGGSKAVAFLTTIGIERQIEFVVDINPFRHGSFLPGTGQEVVPPGFLRSYRPAAVIVMNPIYLGEIREELERMGLDPELFTVDSEPFLRMAPGVAAFGSSLERRRWA